MREVEDRSRPVILKTLAISEDDISTPTDAATQNIVSAQFSECTLGMSKMMSSKSLWSLTKRSNRASSSPEAEAGAPAGPGKEEVPRGPQSDPPRQRTQLPANQDRQVVSHRRQALLRSLDPRQTTKSILEDSHSLIQYIKIDFDAAYETQSVLQSSHTRIQGSHSRRQGKQSRHNIRKRGRVVGCRPPGNPPLNSPARS